MIYTWEVRAEQYGDMWGARWETAERAEAGGPLVSGHVDPGFATDTDARGHAFMWIARYEEAMASPASPTLVTDARVPTDDELAEALAAYRNQFGGDNVTLGEG